MQSVFWWFRITGTVIGRIWWQVLGLILYCAGVVSIHQFTEYKLTFGSTIIPVMGAVVSLLMGFRTNSAYSRYWDGRTIWSQMTKNIRALVLLIWINVPGTEVSDIIEKKSTINLCMAFAVAMKHYLRDEFSYAQNDLQDSIFHLKKYYLHDDDMPYIDADSKIDLDTTGTEMKPPRKPSRQKENDSFIKIPSFSSDPAHEKLLDEDSQKAKKKKVRLMAFDLPTPSNIPLEILCHLHSYLNHLTARENKAESFCLGGINGAIQGLLESLTNFERVLRTPIPLAYSIHLHHCVWLYLLAVPFQFVGYHEWWTMIIMGSAAFCMLGILSIAYEIEDPFGYDANDLPLDDFCAVLRREIQLITGFEPPETKNWIYSAKNKPFGVTELKADEWATKSKEELSAMLQKNAKAHMVIDHVLRNRK